MSDEDFLSAAEQRNAAGRMRAAALSAAAAAIRRNVPDLPSLISNLETAGGSARLVAALRARIGESRPVGIAREARLDARLWADAANGEDWR